MKWIEPAQLPSSQILPGLHPLVAEVLAHRGIGSVEAVQAFLNPAAYSPAAAALIPGITAIAERLEMAIRMQELICVWGDFDVDGQTSTAILFQTLNDLNANVSFHIPVRANEGHGVNIEHLQELIDQGVKVILTCDTGISAHTAAEYANSRQVDLLITDHHEIPETLPPAAAIANPKLLPVGHPLSTLSGSGLAYKLSEELYARFSQASGATRHLDLATLGLVADLTQLTGDSRYLVQRGLATLRRTERLGLKVMMEMAELIPANLTEEHIGFVLGPRLNALGRLGDANPAVDLLTTSDAIRARVLATQLEGLNAQRQLMCSQIYQAAESQLRADSGLLDQPILILGHPTWQGGVVGIVASRLVERYRKPAILFSTPTGQPAHGSARSISRLNITAAIAMQKDLLLNYGGHAMAAGLSLESEKLPEFARRLSKTVQEMMTGVEIEDNLEIDAWLTLPEVDLTLAKAIEGLAPFGPGNEKLTLATSKLRMQSVTMIGRNQEHLKLRMADEAGNSQTVLWWNGAEDKNTIPEGFFDLAYSLRASDWRGEPRIQMELVDFRNLDLEKITVKDKQLEMVDYRNIQEPLKALQSLIHKSSIMVWAEGQEKKITGGKDRNEIESASTLALWTSPPSPDEFRAILARVHPRTIYLFAVTNPNESPEKFIARLAGLLKYAINQREGKVRFSELSASTAQRTLTVRKGVHWLVLQGEIDTIMEKEDDLVVKIGSSFKNLAKASQLWEEIQSLLSETTAYREYFKSAEKDSLFD
jgi:single-stranded-DNA-specific exonuclease